MQSEFMSSFPYLFSKFYEIYIYIKYMTGLSHLFVKRQCLLTELFINI